MKNILRTSNFGFTKWCFALLCFVASLGQAQVRISQVYGNGGNSGAALNRDFVELYNAGNSAVDLSTYGLQYTSATGTGTWGVSALSGSIAPKSYFLIALGSGGANGSAFTADTTPSNSQNLSGTAGKLALTTSTTALSGGAPTSSAIIDLVGYGTTASTWEGTGRAPVPNTAIFRKNGGETDSNDNANDFVAAIAAPRNSSSGGGGSTPTITINPTSLTGLTTTTGANSSVTNYTVTGTNLGATNVTVTPNSSLIEVSTNASSGFATNALTLTQTGGVVSNTVYVRIANVATATNFSTTIANVSGTASNNLTVSGSVTAAGAPSVTVSPTSATGLTNYVGQVSASANYTVTGTNLGGTNLVVTASTNAIEVSTNSATGFTNSFSLTPSGDGTLTNAVYVRISASAPAGAVNATVSNVSGSASNNFTISGTVTKPALTLVLNPTSVAENAGASASTGTVGIPFSLSNDLTVSLVSSNTAAATVPSTVTITNGQTNATFAIAAVANASSYSDATAPITASATNYTSANATLTVRNVDAAPASTISLTSLAINSYTQSFDALGTASITGAISSTVGIQTSLATATGSIGLNGWYATKVGGDGTSATAVTADNGNGNSGLVYNYGVTGATDRALGVLASTTSTMAIGALIKNDTGGEINAIKVSFTAEFWRSSTSTQNVLTCAIGKVDGSNVTTANFLTIPAPSAIPLINGNITGPAAVTNNAALDGNATANQVTFTDVVIPLVLAAGETGFVRWSDVNEAGNDAGLAIDNLKMTAVFNSVATPELSLAGGIYLSDQNLKVSNFGGFPIGTSIYYTVDGTAPTSSSTLYRDEAGIPLIVGNGPITVKALAVQGGSQSIVASVTYDLPKDVANLTALRASATGSTIYRVTGPVTFTAGTSFRQTKFFQDGGAGIQIDDLGRIISTTYLPGDNVGNIVGRISLFNGQLQMVPLQDFGPAVSSGNVVTPLSRTLATLTDADQARLVTIPGVEYQGANGTLVFTTATATMNTAVRDSSTGATYSGWVRNIFSDSDVTGKVVPSGVVTVTGIVQKTTINTVQSLTVGPRNSADAGAPPSLALKWSVDLEIPENGLYFDPEYQYLTLSRVGNSNGDLQVLISCNPETRLSLQNVGVLPQTITIPAGTVSTQLKLMPVDDSNYTGNTLVTITATAVNHTGATASATILEDDVPDTIKPVIALIGANPLLLANGAAYADPGATVTDNVDATRTIQGTGTVNTAAAGDYTITYSASDAANNAAIQVTRTVRVSGPVVVESTYADWSGGATLDSAGLAKYAIGGASSLTAIDGVKPITALTGGFLVITAIVRTDNSSLTVVGQAVTDLANYASGTGVTTVNGVETTDQSGVPTGHKRKTFSVTQGSDTKKFMRLSASLSLSGTNTTVSVARDSGGATFLQVTGATAGSTSGGTATSEKRTVYYFAPDTTSSPTYTGGAWPYVIVQGQLSAGAGVTATLTKNSSGMLLVNGLPAYQYVGDSGSTTANGVGGTWPGMKVDGTKTTTAPIGTIQ